MLSEYFNLIKEINPCDLTISLPFFQNEFIELTLESFNESIHDTGIDSVYSEFEDGCGGSLPVFIRSFYTYPDLIDSLEINYVN